MKLEKRTKIIITLGVIILIVALTYVLNFYVQRLFYQRDYSEHVERYSKEFSVPEYVVYSIIKIESDFDPDATSNKGASGLMQLMPQTYEWLVETREEDKKDIYDPEENIKYGTYYLGMLYERYGDWTLVACAYNAGMGNVDRWLKEDTFKIKLIETQQYVKKFEVVVDKYKSLYYR